MRLLPGSLVRRAIGRRFTASANSRVRSTRPLQSRLTTRRRLIQNSAHVCKESSVAMLTRAQARRAQMIRWVELELAPVPPEFRPRRLAEMELMAKAHPDPAGLQAIAVYRLWRQMDGLQGALPQPLIGS